MLDLSWEPSSDLDEGGSFSYWDLRLNTPLFGWKFAPDWMLAGLFRYRYAEIDWNTQSIFDPGSLHRTDFNLLLAYTPTDSPWLALFAAGPALSTGGGHLDSDDFLYIVAASVGYRFSERFTLLAGAYLSEDFGSARVVPGVAFSWIMSEDWSLLLQPPRLRLAYTAWENWRLAAEGRVDVGRWSVDTLDGGNAFLQRQVMRAGLRVERRVGDNGWLYLAGGWMFNRDLSLESSSGKELFDSAAEGAPYAGAGFYWEF